MRFWGRVALMAVLLAGSPAARLHSETSLSGPILGYFWEEAPLGIRPILGIPGSSTLGPVLATDYALGKAEISPRQDYALGVARSGQVLMVDLRANPVSAQTLDVAQPTAEIYSPDRIALSPRGVSAALYYRDSRSVQIVTGLPASPADGGRFDLSGLPGLATALAISDSGDVALVAGQDGVYGLAAGRTLPLLVFPAGPIHAISFLEDSRDALIADRSRNEISLIRDVTGAAARVPLADEKDGISDPIAVAASADRQRVFVALGRAVAILELGGSPPVLVPCGCQVSGLYRLGADSIFRLNGPSTEPIFVLDARTAEPQILFVPAEPGGPGSGHGAGSPLPIPRRRSR